MKKVSRTSDHVLEDASRLAVEGLFTPHTWVTRPVAKDYGIDLEIEIFDGGVKTGMTFKVQLKGMAHPDHIGAFRDLLLDDLAYWNSLDVPVLIIAFDESSGTLYGKWSHAIDRGPKPRGKKTHRVRFDKTDVLKPTQLRRDVETLRALKTPQGRHILLRAESTEHGDTAAMNALGRAISEASLDRKLRVSRDDLAVSIRLEKDFARAALPVELASRTMHYQNGANIQLAAFDSLVAVAQLLGLLGRYGDAARVASSVLESCATHEENAVPELLAIAAQAEDFDLLVDLYAHAAEHDSTASETYALGLYGLADELTSGQLDRIEKIAADTIANAKTPVRAARLSYNLAQLLRSAGRHAAAAEAATDAIEQDPDGYGRRPEPLLVLGASAWFADDYETACDYYRKAHILAPSNPDVVSKFADALTHAGRYAEALSVFDGAQVEHAEDTDGAAPDSTYGWRDVLLEHALHELVHELDLPDQTRRPHGMSQQQLEDLSGDDATEALRDSDALSPEIWSARLNADPPPDRITELMAIAFFAGHPVAYLLLGLASHALDDESLMSLVADGVGSHSALVNAFAELVEALSPELTEDEAAHLRKLAAESRVRQSFRVGQFQLVTDDNVALGHPTELSVNGE